MADDNEDPDVKAGRAIAGGSKTAAPAVVVDPDVAAGAAIANAPPPATTTTTTTEQPSWTWRGMARNVAAVPLDVGANLLNFASDPSGHILSPLLAAGGSAYDFVAPHLGLDRLTPEQRADLAGRDPYATNPGSRIEQAAIGDVGGTPAEQVVRNALATGATAAYLGPYGISPFLAGTSASLGGQAASSVVPDWAKPGVELLGQVAGAKLGSTLENVGTRATQAMTGTKTSLGQAFDRLGVTDPLVGDVSGSPAAKSVQAYTAQAPGSQGAVIPRVQRTVGQFDNAVEDTASRLGQSQTAQAAGDVLQSQARNWKDVVFPAREQAAWAPVDRAMANATVDPSNYRGALSALTARLSALPETQKQLLPPKTQALLDAINQDVPPGSTMTWQQAQSLRTAIGNVMGIPEIVQSVGKDQLKAAYGGISADMKDAARANNALPAFDAANRVSTDGHAFIDNTLSRIVKANNPAQETITPEQAAKTVVGSGDTTLQTLRREMPTAADELAAWKLRDMRLATPGASGATGQETSIGSFMTDLNRLRQASPGGYDALYAGVRQRMDDLATVGDAIKETSRYANTSRTGPFQTLAGPATAAGTALLAGANPLEAALAAAAPFAANYALGRYVTSPTVSRMTAAPGPRQTVNPLAAAVIANLQNQR